MNKPLLLPYNTSFRIRSRGRLPHWELDDAVYFFTYRLHDALPQKVLAELERERTEIIRRVAGCRAQLSVEQRWRIDEDFGHRLDEELDKGYGSCLLKTSSVAEILIENWFHFDEVRYRMIAWSVMPNHVHLIVHLFVGAMLGRTLHSWKSFSAHETNRILEREGQLWQREYFDRIVRDRRDLINKVNYVLNNPKSAGLKAWKWVGVRADRLADLV